MTKAIIFDFFGVLAIRGSASFRKTFFPDDSKKMLEAKEIQDELGLGKIGYDDFITRLAKIGGVDRGTVLAFTEDYQPNAELVRYIGSELKPRYKLGIISNAGDDRVKKILGAQCHDWFDDIILSYQFKMIKPQPNIYKLSAENLDIKTAECIFIDDILTYCKGAEDVGMKSIWYKDFRQMKTELEDLLSSADN